MARSEKKITNNNLAPKMSKGVTLADDADTGNSNVGNAFLGDNYANMLWVGVTSPVALVYHDGTTQTLAAVVAGQWHFIAPTKNVQDTGTTTTDVEVGVSFSKG